MPLCATYRPKQVQAHPDFKGRNKEFWSHIFQLPQLLIFSELYTGPLARKIMSMLSSLPRCLSVLVAPDSCWVRVWLLTHVNKSVHM